MVVNQGFGTLAAPLEGLRATGENSHHQPRQSNKVLLLLLECVSEHLCVKSIICNIANPHLGAQKGSKKCEPKKPPQTS